MGELGSIVDAIKTLGVPVSVALAACFWAAWERRENRLMFQKLFDLATAQIEASYKHELALQALRSELNPP